MKFETKLLKEFADITMGQSPKSKYYNTEGKGLPFLQGNRTFGERNPHYDTYTTTYNKIGLENDTIMSVRAPVGEINQLKTKTALGRGVCSIRSKEKSDSDFLYYLLKNNSKKIINQQSGTVFGSINKKVIENFPVKVPSSSKIRKIIGRFLGDFDKQIEILVKINRNLEELAKLLFENSYTKNQDFQNWKTKKLGDVIELFDKERIPLSSNERLNKEKLFPYYGATGIMDYIDDYIFDGVYLLLAEDGTVETKNGNPILQYVFEKFWVNNHAHIIKGRNGWSTEELYLLLLNYPIQSAITGAVQKKINQKNLKSLTIKKVPKEVLSNLDKQIQPIFNLIRNNIKEIKNLEVIRDYLLPKLISGKIDVSDLDI